MPRNLPSDNTNITMGSLYQLKRIYVCRVLHNRFS